MKMIRITVDNEISVHEFPEGTFSEQNAEIRKQIGPECEIYEHVMPKRLYSEFGGSNKISNIPGQCVAMLVDEEGFHHKLDMNVVGSWLYQSDRHGSPILGNILIVGEVWNGNGISFCGMSEETLPLWYPVWEVISRKARGLS